MASKELSVPEHASGTSAAKARAGYWDAVKGGLMVLVVFGHFIQVYLETLGGGTTLSLNQSCA